LRVRRRPGTGWSDAREPLPDRGNRGVSRRGRAAADPRDDGPARAIAYARTIVELVRSIGLDLAGTGEVLVSSTVKDLVAGSGIEFDDRGSHELKGVPGEWSLYAVRNS
jgi:hypothetical protein